VASSRRRPGRRSSRGRAPRRAPGRTQTGRRDGALLGQYEPDARRLAVVLPSRPARRRRRPRSVVQRRRRPRSFSLADHRPNRSSSICATGRGRRISRTRRAAFGDARRSSMLRRGGPSDCLGVAASVGGDQVASRVRVVGASRCPPPSAGNRRARTVEARHSRSRMRQIQAVAAGRTRSTVQVWQRSNTSSPGRRGAGEEHQAASSRPLAEASTRRRAPAGLARSAGIAGKSRPVRPGPRGHDGAATAAVSSSPSASKLRSARAPG